MLIEIICTNCDAVLKAPESVLGKRVKCKKCGEAFVARATGEDDEDEDEAPPAKTVKMKSAKAKPKAVESDDDGMDETPKQKKKGKKKKQEKSSSMLIALVAVGALVLIGGGIGVYFGLIKEDKPTTPSSGGSLTSGTPAPKGPSAPSAPAASTEGWVEIVSEPGKFRVKFPRQPNEATKDEDSPFGKLPETTFTLDNSTVKEFFVAGSFAIPDEKRSSLSDDQILDTFIEWTTKEAAEKGMATIVSPKKIAQQGHNGREFTIRIKQQGVTIDMIARMVIVGNRLISFSAVGGDPVGFEPKRKAFFDSLKFD